MEAEFDSIPPPSLLTKKTEMSFETYQMCKYIYIYKHKSVVAKSKIKETNHTTVIASLLNWRKADRHCGNNVVCMIIWCVFRSTCIKSTWEGIEAEFYNFFSIRCNPHLMSWSINVYSSMKIFYVQQFWVRSRIFAPLLQGFFLGFAYNKHVPSIVNVTRYKQSRIFLSHKHLSFMICPDCHLFANSTQ
jgi:hypothetical protein